MMSAPAATSVDHVMSYPYDLFTAACLFIIVVSTSIMLMVS
ncbi:hypothetical protein LFL96_23310 [Paraburkholderia sp. D15]|nr:hypothetical protein [Paraburkholderia sp. D15]WGS53970.1 hypothetical protein LFL96_23310 [Paraburkholderia sp. D15]